MTFTVRYRGDSGGTIRHDYLCPVHGHFEAEVPRAEVPDSVKCEWRDDDVVDCGLPSPWSPTTIACKVSLVGFSRGKSEAPPTKDALTTRDLAEGMPLSEWKAKRAKLRQDKRRQRNREIRG